MDTSCLCLMGKKLMKLEILHILEKVFHESKFLELTSILFFFKFHNERTIAREEKLFILIV